MSNTQTLVELRAQLVTVAGRDDTSIDTAVGLILEAIELYEVTRPGITEKASGRRIARKPSRTRQNLNRLQRHIDGLLEAWDGLDIDARVLIGDHMPTAPNDDGISLPRPLGYFPAKRLRELQATIQKARAAADELPTKETNHARAVLAADVAIVFRDVLGVRPTSTRHDKVKQGAGYSRVLAIVLALAGEFACDQERLIQSGLTLLDDPDLPHNAP